MGKNNGGRGSNNIPGWVKRDLQMLKRVSVSLVEMQRDNQRRFAENENILSEVRNEVSEMRRHHSEDMVEMRQQTASLKRLSDIHSKSILKLLKKV